MQMCKKCGYWQHFLNNEYLRIQSIYKMYMRIEEEFAIQLKIISEKSRDVETCHKVIDLFD